MPPEKGKTRRPLNADGPVVEEAKHPSSTLPSPSAQGTAATFERPDATTRRSAPAEVKPLRPVTPLERHIMHLAEDRRVELGWPMWAVDDRAGTADGHYSKCLAAASPSGRRPTLPTLDLFVSALFTRNYVMTITALDPMPSAPGIPRSSYGDNGRMVRHWRHRRHFQALGMMGGKARMASMSKKQKTALGKRAAPARWHRHRGAKR